MFVYCVCVCFRALIPKRGRHNMWIISISHAARFSAFWMDVGSRRQQVKYLLELFSSYQCTKVYKSTCSMDGYLRHEGRIPIIGFNY